MKRIVRLLCVVSFLLSLPGYAQDIRNFNNNWVFGDSIHLKFSNTPNANQNPILNTAVTHDMRNEECNASISDGFGNLLFYVGHPNNLFALEFNLYDANNNPMPNGQNLISSEASSQGVIITKDPEDCSEYYVFYVSNVAGNGLRYSKVDMDLNGGMGDVIPGEKDILLYNTRSNKVILAQQEDSKYFWVITRRIDPAVGPLDEFISIPLIAGGVFGAPVISTFAVPPSSTGLSGYMTMRPDNLKLADATYPAKRVYTYDFNPATGVFSNRVTVYSSLTYGPYGASYSPAGNVLYITYTDNSTGFVILRRMDLATDPTGATFVDTPLDLSDGIHAVQRSPKGIMYVTQGSSQNLHQVLNPDNYAAPNIIVNGQTVTRLVLNGLPNQYFPWESVQTQDFVSLAGSQEICYNSSTTIGGTADSLNAVYSWEGQIMTPSGWSTPSSSYLVNPNVTNPTTINLTSGVTRFILTILNECGDTIFSNKELVYLDSLSTPVISGDIDYCAGETITPLTSTPPIAGVINWYSDVSLTTLAGTGTSFTPSNTVGATTYYVVEQITGGMVPQQCTGIVTSVTVTIAPQIPLCYTKRAAKWYMGDGIALNFLCASPPTPLDDCTSAYSGNMENNVSISDDNGNLLFYAYDNLVKNRNHVVMPNGSGLNTDYSASQGFLPVPNPSNPNRYYLFTIGSNGGPGLYFSEIDLLADGGLGDVIPATKNTLLMAGVPEHLTAVESCTPGETWVIVHNSSNLYSFKVSGTGISAAVISPATVTLPSSPGQLKASPTGRHVALSVQNSPSFLYTFDNETGEICYKETLTHGGYGCSFSNNGQYFYANDMLQGIWQYNAYVANVNLTGEMVYDPWAAGTFLYGGMHLGPDCKLYVFGSNNSMGTVINNPNSSGLACNVQVASFPISNGTPDYSGHFASANYVQSWFKDPTYVETAIDADFTFSGTCATLPVSFINTSTTITECPKYTWNFGDPASGINNTSTLENPTHQFSAPGTYTVSLTVEERCQTNTQTYDVTVTVPTVTITGDTIVCINENVLLTASGGTAYSWTGPSWQMGGVSSSTATVFNQGDPMMGADNEGWYYVTVTDNGCATTDSVYVAILQSPDMNIQQTIGTCSVLLTTTLISSNGPITSYSWTVGGTPPTLGTNSSLTVAPTVLTEYLVFYVDSAGCAAGSLTWVGAVTPLAVPVITTTPASCSAAGTATISNYVGTQTYTFTPAGPTVGMGGVISGMSPATSYSVITSIGSCVSLASTSFSVAAQLSTPSAPIIYTPDASYCMGDNVATINTSSGDLWYTDAGLTNQVFNGQNYVPAQTLGTTTYYVIDTTGACDSQASSVDVTFTNCAPDLCPTNLLVNGDFETYSSCPTNIGQIANATGWLGTGTYMNTICNGYYNFPGYYPYFNAANYNLGVNGGGTFPPPSGAGYASLVIGGTMFKEFIVQPIDLYCSVNYSLQLRVMTPRYDNPQPDNSLCVYGSNVAPPYSGCDPNLTLLTCLPSPSSVTNDWTLQQFNFTPTQDFNYLVVTGQCPTSTTVGGTIFIDDMVLCGTCVNPPSSVSASQTAPETCNGNDGAGTVTATSCSSPLNYSWALTANPGVSVSSVQSPANLVAGSYVVTVSDGANCSTTGSVTITTTSSVPAPTATVTTVPTCTVPTGTITVSAPVGPNYEYSIDGGATWQTSAVFSGLAALSTITVIAQDLNSGCVSSGTIVNVPAVPASPSVPTLSTIAATCSAAGTAMISNYVGTQTYTFTPAGPTAGVGGTITGMTTGTSYTVTTSNGSCTSAASASFSIAAQLTTPVVPTVTTTASTCSAAGTATISNYVGTQTYTFTPSGPVAGAGGVISGMVPGTSYSVTAGNGSCTSSASISFSIAAQLTVPPVPIINVTAPTCITDGSAMVSNYDGTLTYAFLPAGPIVGAGGVISGMTFGTNYTLSASNGTCTSVASATFSIAAQLTTPAVPIITTGSATCSSDGSATITNYTSSVSYTFTPSGLAVGAGGLITGMSAGTSYTVTASNGSCSSAASTSFSVDQQFSSPVVTVTPDTSFTLGETITLIASGADTYTWSPSVDLNISSGPSVVASPEMTTLYCVVGSDANGCTDTACVLLTLVLDCGNVFIPNVFSPNENNMDDHLCIFSGECLTNVVFRIYNRWGELVFETTDPSVCWDGKFRDKYVSSGSFAYTFEGTDINGEIIEREGTITVLR